MAPSPPAQAVPPCPAGSASNTSSPHFAGVTGSCAPATTSTGDSTFQGLRRKSNRNASPSGAKNRALSFLLLRVLPVLLLRLPPLLRLPVLLLLRLLLRAVLPGAACAGSGARMRMRAAPWFGISGGKVKMKMHLPGVAAGSVRRSASRRRVWPLPNSIQASAGLSQSASLRIVNGSCQWTTGHAFAGRPAHPGAAEFDARRRRFRQRQDDVLAGLLGFGFGPGDRFAGFRSGVGAGRREGGDPVVAGHRHLDFVEAVGVGGGRAAGLPFSLQTWTGAPLATFAGVFFAFVDVPADRAGDAAVGGVRFAAGASRGDRDSAVTSEVGGGRRVGGAGGAADRRAGFTRAPFPLVGEGFVRVVPACPGLAVNACPSVAVAGAGGGASGAVNVDRRRRPSCSRSAAWSGGWPPASSFRRRSRGTRPRSPAAASRWAAAGRARRRSCSSPRRCRCR